MPNDRSARIRNLITRNDVVVRELNEAVDSTLAALNRDLRAEGSDAAAARLTHPLAQQVAACKEVLKRSQAALADQAESWTLAQLDEAEAALVGMEGAVQIFRAAVERARDERTH